MLIACNRCGTEINEDEVFTLKDGEVLCTSCLLDVLDSVYGDWEVAFTE